jgi:hypothetical protein
MALAEALEGLLRLPGATYSCVVERDSGRVLAEVGHGEAGAGDPEGVVPYSVARWGTAVAAMFDTTAGDELDDVMIAGRRSYHLVRPLGVTTSVLVYLRLDRTRSNLAAARRELAGVRWSAAAPAVPRARPASAVPVAVPPPRSGPLGGSAARGATTSTVGSAVPPARVPTALPPTGAGSPRPEVPAARTAATRARSVAAGSPTAGPAAGALASGATAAAANAAGSALAGTAAGALASGVTAAPANAAGSALAGSAAARSTLARANPGRSGRSGPAGPDAGEGRGSGRGGSAGGGSGRTGSASAAPTRSATVPRRQIPLPRRESTLRTSGAALRRHEGRAAGIGAQAGPAEAPTDVPEGFAMSAVLEQSWARDPGTLRRLIAGLRRMA